MVNTRNRNSTRQGPRYHTKSVHGHGHTMGVLITMISRIFKIKIMSPVAIKMHISLRFHWVLTITTLAEVTMVPIMTLIRMLHKPQVEEEGL